jgi:hypothetical protein
MGETLLRRPLVTLTSWLGEHTQTGTKVDEFNPFVDVGAAWAWIWIGMFSFAALGWYLMIRDIRRGS